MVNTHLWRDRDDVLAFPIADEVKGLQGRYNILSLNGSHLAHVLDGYVASVFAQDLQQHLRPVAPEAQKS